MKLIQLIFWMLVIYLAYRLIKIMVFGPLRKPEHTQVQGKARKRPLDLSNLDVEDAKFEEIKDKTKDSK
ncbi:MAG: hypothetical protein ONB44_14860 [candidate division KSB1 bacterium]|nr:hypothetical protein [candidate division KSB1 bacterium]MDZ7303408.1 hypothetical protein [candidate division KSB1 bacterium]MDZ7312274.1 hypothetical protein [candidate division KSB1 bacterium]